jgi:hypothetical protein
LAGRGSLRHGIELATADFHRSLDQLGLTKIDELGSNINDLKESHQRLSDTITEPAPVSQSMLEVQEMIRDMNESHQETHEEMRRIAHSISSIETVVTRLTGATAVTTPEKYPSLNDNEPSSLNRRPLRRRTGPLTAQQRENAALIRRLGACADCRRKRTAVGSGPYSSSGSWQLTRNRLIVSPLTS